MKPLRLSFIVRTAFFTVAMSTVAIGMAPVQADTTPPAYLKDLHITQITMTEIVAEESPAGSVVASTTDTGARLGVSAALDRSDRKYRHGESVALTIGTNEDAYVWVFDTGTSGKVHQIFPNQYQQNNRLRAGMPVTIPPSDGEYEFLVSRPEGPELITVIASRNDMPLTRELVDHETASGPFMALRGTAVSVVKDLAITLKKQAAQEWVAHHEVFHVVE